MDKAIPNIAICPECETDAMFPTAWEEMPRTEEWPDHWLIMLHCGNCDIFVEDIYSQDEVELFDEWIDECADEIQKSLEKFTRSNMEDYAARFIVALEHDGIVPMDF